MRVFQIHQVPCADLEQTYIPPLLVIADSFEAAIELARPHIVGRIESISDKGEAIQMGDIVILNQAQKDFKTTPTKGDEMLNNMFRIESVPNPGFPEPQDEPCPKNL